MKTSTESVVTITSLLRSVFAPPPKPTPYSFETANFYANLTEPDLGEIRTAIQNERRKFKKSIQQGNWSTWYTIAFEVLRIVHNTTRRFLQRPFIASMMFMIILSLVSAISSVLIDLMTVKLIQARTRMSSLGHNFWTQYLIWVVYGIAFAIASASCVRYISPFIIGSGMADMKTMMSGIVMDRVLDVRTGVGKFLCIATTMSAGFTVGRVGPFIHITACMGQQLFKLRLFKRIRKNDFIKCNMVCIACAVGCGATFGTPVGAVIFAVEVSTTYFLVSNLWKCFMCSLLGSGFFYLARQKGIFPQTIQGVSISMFPTNFQPFPYQPFEYGYFILLGIVLGLLGGLFLKALAYIVILRNRFKITREARYSTTVLVCILIAAIDFNIPLAQQSASSIFKKLFGVEELKGSGMNHLQTLGVLFVFKYICTILSLACPIANGVTVQSMIMGGCVGRLVGELLNSKYPSVVPGGYAVVASCAFACSITKCISMVVIMLEMTGQISYTIPCLICGLIARGVASCFTTSIYDIMIKIRNLPCLTLLSPSLGQNVMAFNIMKSSVDMISTECTLSEIKVVLSNSSHKYYPIVDSRKKQLLLGEARREYLERMISENRNDQIAIQVTTSIEPPANTIQIEMENIRESSGGDSCLVSTETSTSQADQSKVENMADNVFEGSRVGTPAASLYAEDHKHIIHAAKYLSMSNGMMLEVDPAPFCIQELTALNKIYYLFAMLGLSHAWVTSQGVLKGILTKKQLILASKDMEYYMDN